MDAKPTEIRWRRPRFRLTCGEFFAWVRWATTPKQHRAAAAVPRGDGHAVLVLPAFLHGDGYTAQVRDFLNDNGYVAFGWGLGVNIVPSKRRLNGARDRLIEISDQHGPVSLVGFSLGGLFARWLSMQMPERVRRIVTVCSPIHKPGRNFWFPLGPLPDILSDIDLPQLTRDIARGLSVPATILFNRHDGLVNFAACVDEHAGAGRHIEIGTPHVLITQSPEVTSILAEILARPVTAGN